MFISHRYRFIVFPDPLGSCRWLNRALAPWVDQHIGAAPGARRDTLLFQAMTPQEAEIAFALMGRAFDSYTKIAIVENPYKRMARLYERIVQMDPVWQLRGKVGLANPTFGSWLEKTKARGVGAGTRFSPRWQRLGAWSADAWADGRINRFVRADNAAQDLQRVFDQMITAPVIVSPAQEHRDTSFKEMSRYDAKSTKLIEQRYKSDLQIFHTQRHDLHLAA